MPRLNHFPILKPNHILVGVCLTTGLIFTYANAQRMINPEACQTQAEHTQSEHSAKTELLFGLSKSDGSIVTEREFQQFIDREVTPRFPEGLTIMNASGQFKNAKNTIVKENSKLLLLIHPNEPKDSDRIEQIRKTYVTTFQQESVLRLDEQSCISF